MKPPIDLDDIIAAKLLYLSKSIYGGIKVRTGQEACFRLAQDITAQDPNKLTKDDAEGEGA